MSIPTREQKLLAMRSGGRCAMPNCHRLLVIDKTDQDRESIIGEMAHIKGEKEGAARYDSFMTDKEKNAYLNLLFLCTSCHKMIDDQEKTYTVEKLHEIKENHEKWVIESTKNEVINVTFAELSVVTKYLTSGQSNPNDSYTIIPPKEKIKKNNLSGKIETLITRGMIQVSQVAEFIDKCPDIEFGERLKQGFVEKYERLTNEENLDSDELFEALLEFASGKSLNFLDKAAGLTVLVYLFEKCEVFEK